MTVLQIALCDDEILILERNRLRVEDILTAMEIPAEISLFSDGHELLAHFQRKVTAYDLILLDLEMPQIHGLDLAQTIRALDAHVLIIFLTAYDQYVFSAFTVDAFRYIRKDAIDTELPLALHDALEYLEKREHPFYILKSDNGLFKLYYDQIVSIERINRKATVSTLGRQQFTTSDTIGQLQKIFEPHGFILINQGCLINIAQLKGLLADQAQMYDGQIFPISRLKRKEVNSAINRYWHNALSE